DQDHVVERELALSGGIVERKRQDASVGQPDTPSLALLAARFLQDDGRRPVDVVERQPRIRQRALPGRPLVADLLVRVDPLNGLGEARLRGAKLDAPVAALVAPKPLL